MGTSYFRALCANFYWERGDYDILSMSAKFCSQDISRFSKDLRLLTLKRKESSCWLKAVDHFQPHSAALRSGT